MTTRHLSLFLTACLPAIALAGGAHSHGSAELDVAVEAPAILVELRVPLHDLVGFERPPRNQAERERVEQAIARLEAADRLFRIDPAGGCALAAAAIEAPLLGRQGDGAGAPSPAAAGQAAHGDLVGSFRFECRDARAARHLDLGLFPAFKSIRTVDARVASPDGQSAQRLRATQPRLILADRPPR